MLTDQIIYFILVIGVLVTVHEFGHFIITRGCAVCAPIYFRWVFGMRLFGFNKRAGFSFRENPPNKLTITIEEGSGIGGSARQSLRRGDRHTH